jgi:hypothetical protein
LHVCFDLQASRAVILGADAATASVQHGGGLGGAAAALVLRLLSQCLEPVLQVVQVLDGAAQNGYLVCL